MTPRDRYAVLWTRTAAGPRKMGNLVATSQEVRFSYEREFLAHPEVAGLTLLLPPALLGEQPFVWPVTEAMPLIPRLMALLPGRNPRNVQRRLYADMLARRANPPAPGFDTEWELLMLAGRGGIGHVDVFRDDRAALSGYAEPPRPGVPLGSRSGIWRFIREEARADLQAEAEEMLTLLGPTPSVGGMIPKLLATIPDRPTWDGTISAPGARVVGGAAFVDAIVKIEYPEYAGLSALEALCLDLHAELGFVVPRHWRAEVDGLAVLAIERFDRTRAGLSIPMESFFSVYALGQRRVRAATDAELEQLPAMLRKLSDVADIDTKAISHEVYRRILMAFLTGNGDLHLENLAFLGGPQNITLAPVFDPSPMRAYDRHDLLSALPFEIDDALGLSGSVVRLGGAFGLSKDDARALLADLGHRTRDYPARVRALEGVPPETRERLARRVEGVRSRLLGGGVVRVS